MEIINLTIKPNEEPDKKQAEAIASLEKLIAELNRRSIPDNIINLINLEIEQLNSFTGLDKDLIKQLQISQNSILTLIEMQLKLVPKGYYQNLWLAIGMATFGIPLGVAIGFLFGNMAFIGVGLPIGMVIGIALGSAMDQKASEKGKQLNVDITL